MDVFVCLLFVCRLCCCSSRGTVCATVAPSHCPPPPLLPPPLPLPPARRWLQDAEGSADGEDVPLNRGIVQRLQRFGMYGRLKQVALRTVSEKSGFCF